MAGTLLMKYFLWIRFCIIILNMFYDNHVHMAPFSNDARQTLQELMDFAGRVGLSGIMTTDHYEKDVFYAGREDVFALAEYFQTLQPVRDATAKSCFQLLIGVELGYMPHLTGHYAEITSTWPFDGVILSLHILDGEDPFVDASMYQREKVRLYDRYLQVMQEMVLDCPDFDILGHFDYISRYGRYPDRKMHYADTPDGFDALLQALIQNGKTLEINTRSVSKFKALGYAGDDCWPDAAIVRRYLEMGGPGVSLGSDGHLPNEAGQLFKEGLAWLKSLGCRHLVHYVRRQAVFDRLD
jgi:histidinol-phosphatase (PHP family)